jgi:ribonuclease Z
MKITILGNNSALPAHDRYPTCQVLSIDGTMVLIDCGEGAQMLLKKYSISWRSIRYIFISHLHGDHYFGLPGLLTSMSLLGRTEALVLYAPKELEAILQQILDVATTTLSYPLRFVALPEGEAMLFEHNLFSLFCFPVVHRIACHGLLVTEKSKGRKLLPERCRYYEIPSGYYKQLKSGADYERKDGFLVKNDWVTDAAKPDKRYAYCADSLYTDAFLTHIQGVDYLYHESTYLEADVTRAAARFHSTAQQAAALALKANVKHLILGHYSSKYKDISPFQEEARLIFPNTHASVEGDEFEF